MENDVQKYFNQSNGVGTKVANLLKTGDSRQTEIFETRPVNRGQISFILFTFTQLFIVRGTGTAQYIFIL